jgi:UDP-N-acetylmuramoyl-L-alanyl-D-glutamate--2,6-diaminopimelate ligase
VAEIGIKTKRPEMARIATMHADQVILTSDNPRTENPDVILDQMWEGVPKKNKITCCGSLIEEKLFEQE